MIDELKYYKSVYFDKDQEYKELGIKKTNQRILVNHEELVMNLLNYNKKVPVEVEQITLGEHYGFMVNENHSGLEWIDDRLTNLTIKEVEIPVELAYCSECDEDVSYSTQETTKKATIRETTFCYTHVIANCNVCGERVFPVSLGTLNDKTKYEELEKERKEELRRYFFSQKRGL